MKSQVLRKKEKAHKPKEKRDFSSLLKHKYCFIVFSTLLFLQINNYFAFAQNTETESLEEKIFHQTYPNESQEVRLSRLEEFIFGKTNQSESIENRISKLNTAINTEPKEKKEDKTEPIVLKKQKPESQENNQAETIEPKIIYDKQDSGIIGTIGLIEEKVFNKTFPELPFNKRIENLETKILSKSEFNRNKQKPLLERVSILTKRTGIVLNEQNIPVPNPNLNKNYPQSYTIDPRTGFLINERTGETVLDGQGNPISVRIPKALQAPPALPPQNYGYYNQNQLNQLQNQYPNSLPYGNAPPFGGLPGQGQLPYDLFLDQGVNSDPGY